MNSSSCYEGKALHRAIFHKYMCKKGCVCMKKFESEIKHPPKTPGPRSPTGRKLAALQNWLNKMGLIIISCEPAVGWDSARAATFLDAVCVYANNPSRFFLLEFKTGYLPKHRTASSQVMTGEGGSMLKCNALNKHMLQLWFGIESFTNTHSITPHDGAVLYFQQVLKPRRAYACCGYLYSQWINPLLRNKLESQIFSYRF